LTTRTDDMPANVPGIDTPGKDLGQDLLAPSDIDDGARVLPPRGPVIMIVDDEPTTIDVLQILLEDAGYEQFVTTTDAACALALIRETNPDLLLLDLVMPEVGGLEILRDLRADESMQRIPVVVLTSATDANTKLNALELGATDFLAKPVDPSELALRLRNTLAAKAYQDRLANYDRLTDLPNKTLFMKRLQGALERAARDRRSCAVLHMGLNRFGQINDTLGHEMGDRLLEQVAHRLDGITRRGEDDQPCTSEDPSVAHVSRFEGGEFVLCVPDLATVGQATKVANRLLGAFNAPFFIGGEQLIITLGIGIAVFPSDGQDTESLLKHARVATSHARRSGQSGFEYYSDEQNARSIEQLRLEHDLHKALERGELTLHYQPKFELASGRLAGAEALLRWHHPVLGLVPSATFIPLAEEIGLIVPIGYWILHTAYKQSLAWESGGLHKVRIAVNMSSVQFRESQLLARFHAAVQTRHLDTSRLTLEITESMLIDQLEDTIGILEQLRAMGFKISLDDFGTGYSSLSHLKRLPIDELKIDRSFVVDAPQSEDDAAILRAIIGMAHGLRLPVVAEGIETDEQHTFLGELGCDQVQGFLLGKPMPAEDFLARFRPNGTAS